MTTKILIRNKARHRYLSAANTWVRTTARARDFQSPMTAIAHVVANELKGIELVYVFPNEAYQFAVPVTAFQQPDARPRRKR